MNVLVFVVGLIVLSIIACIGLLTYFTAKDKKKHECIICEEVKVARFDDGEFASSTVEKVETFKARPAGDSPISDRKNHSIYHNRPGAPAPQPKRQAPDYMMSKKPPTYDSNRGIYMPDTTLTYPYAYATESACEDNNKHSHHSNNHSSNHSSYSSHSSSHHSSHDSGSSHSSHDSGGSSDSGGGGGWD